ncbi:MAG: DUF255 domain-containing protein, partial [Luteolibacter sp.]
GSLPGAVYRSQATSPIHWQPWTKESLARAKAANRLVFGVIAVPEQPGFQSVLASLAAAPDAVAVINQNYVPVLIDGDASREMGLLTADLCSEIKRSLQLPLFIWMTPDANPVAWIPVSNTQPGKVAELFQQSHSMVIGTWTDDQQYMLKNSALDNSIRRTRIGQRKNTKVMSEQPGEDAIRAIRQLVSLYDPFTRSFDEAGGLFPAGAIDLLSTAAVHPGLPLELRTRCMETTRDLLLDLLPSAMFDPLEGGVFSARRGRSWTFPNFYRECAGQARAAVALLNAYRATGDPHALEKALGVIAYAEKNYSTPDGLFAVGMTRETEQAGWLWSVEEIEEELPPEDAAWWIKATGMQGLGNLPSEVDPHREFFRSNSLGMSKSVAELAADQSQTIEVFAPRFETVRNKLLQARNRRVGEIARDQDAHAGVSFRMVSAFAAAYGATGDVAFREKAVALLKKSKVAFSDGPRLRMFAKDAPKSIGEGRAFLYGLALQAVLDVAAITSDQSWLDWSEDLATTSAELFTDSEFLKECPDDAQIMDLPVTDLVMLFGDSTAGMVSSAECRLAGYGRPLLKSFSELATPLPVYAVDRPILHTDLLQATIARSFNVTVIAGTGLPPEMKLACEQLPMRMIQRRLAKADDQIPADSVKIIFASGTKLVVSTPAALQEALLPSRQKL